MSQTRAEGVNIRTEVIDEKDNVIKHTLIVNVTQFTHCLNRHAHKGLTYFELVKRREPSYTGHSHWLRLGNFTSSQTEYKPEYNHIAKRLSTLGHDENEIAYILSITDMMLQFWKKQFPAFCEAIRQGQKNFEEQASISVSTMRPNEKNDLNRYGNKPNEMR